ncbi:hypothetical protein [Saliphagus infecundisoli]|uniref:Lipoprotein n=1 Tax=Saliphagus infecundisoli TaxID=1849069 RepID=A0ABD5QFD0_9EURY|nr:hypothetical protein [Saliphagus infecundisoli]
MPSYHVGRREALGAFGGLLVTSSGCLSTVGFRSENGGVVVTRLSIENDTENSYDVLLELTADGDRIHSDRYAIGPRDDGALGGQVVDADLPGEPGPVVIRAETDGRSAEIDLTDRYDDRCVAVQTWIESDGELTFWTADQGTGCYGDD